MQGHVDGVTGLMTSPLLRKSNLEFAVMVSFRGLVVTCKMVLGLIKEQIPKVIGVQFISGTAAEFFPFLLHSLSLMLSFVHFLHSLYLLAIFLRHLFLKKLNIL